jgi:serine/threonine protein phosphatase PrpC
MVNISPPQWLCTGKSVRGASHDRSGLPNQDAISWYPESRMGAPLILAVSDGHGSAKSFRSDRGSQFAVQIAIEVIQEFLLADPIENIHTSIVKNMEDMVKRLLPTKITERWQDIVRSHIQENEFTDEEKTNLSIKEGEKSLNSIQDNPFLVYGATLLVVAVTDSFILYLQIGDGDILRVDEDGKTTKPLVRSADLIGNETTSLCMRKAWNQFQIVVEAQNVSTPKPALILLSTDGYSNSYASDEEFFKIGADYLQEIREIGIDSLEHQLEELLKGISSGGSGDDITIGIIQKIEKTNRDGIDRQEQTTANGDDVMEAKDRVLPGKSAMNNRGVNQNLLGIASLLLAIISTCLSGYLFWRLVESETTLAKIATSDRQHQEEINSIKKRINLPEIKQNTPIPSQPNSPPLVGGASPVPKADLLPKERLRQRPTENRESTTPQPGVQAK